MRGNWLNIKKMYSRATCTEDVQCNAFSCKWIFPYGIISFEINKISSYVKYKWIQIHLKMEIFVSHMHITHSVTPMVATSWIITMYILHIKRKKNVLIYSISFNNSPELFKIQPLHTFCTLLQKAYAENKDI